MAQQVDGGNRCDRADNGCKANETKIVGIGDAVIDREHETHTAGEIPNLHATLHISM
jgi:hypothetical protein